MNTEVETLEVETPVPAEAPAVDLHVENTRRLTEDLQRVIYSYAGTLTVASVVGCLEFVKYDAIHEAGKG